jgi:hypothetical protein
LILFLLYAGYILFMKFNLKWADFSSRFSWFLVPKKQRPRLPLPYLFKEDTEIDSKTPESERSNSNEGTPKQLQDSHTIAVESISDKDRNLSSEDLIASSKQAPEGKIERVEPIEDLYHPLHWPSKWYLKIWFVLLWIPNLTFFLTIPDLDR